MDAELKKYFNISLLIKQDNSYFRNNYKWTIQEIFDQERTLLVNNIHQIPDNSSSIFFF